MRAVVLQKPITAQELCITQVPMPQVKPGWVLVQVKAFGINRSEIFTRQGHSPSVKLPRIIGIECVGVIADPSDSHYCQGQQVISMMGGLGRAFDGSYAEYALIPTEQVYAMHWNKDWASLAAVPEMYYTAWCSLIDTLHLQSTDSLLIRGATSSVGLAAIQIAHAMGISVAATTRNKDKKQLLHRYGADIVLVDDDTLVQQIEAVLPQKFDKILELIGTTTLASSFALLKQGGILCMAGILGGQWELERFAPMDVIPSGSYFTIYDSQYVNRQSLEAMLAFLHNHDIVPPIAKIFDLEHIAQAHALMESNMAGGKIVVTID